MPIHGYPGNVITANPTEPSQTSASGVWTTEQQLINQSAGRWPPPYYLISRSLRFNSADSAYLSRTFGSNGNQKAWTLSFWVKRSKLGDFFDLFGVNAASPDQKNFRFNSDDTLTFYVQTSAATVVYLQTSQVFRDVSAWYHVVLVIDTANATSTDRIRLYANGSRITAFSSTTYPSLNLDIPSYNTAIAHYLGSFGPGTSLFNGYMTEVNFVDGQALTPSSFGQNDPNTGVWSPIKYTGTYGTNGFYLNFSDNSGTTSTTLGKDSSGNGNNWTPNNFSVTAGAGNDSMVDSPTSYGTDTGVGGEVRGNYATWNPIYKDTIATTTATSNGNLDTTGQFAYSTIGFPSGKFYFECTVGSNNNQFIGVSTNPYAAANLRAYNKDGTYYTGSGWIAYGATYTTNDIIGVAIDMDSQTIQFYKNGSSQGQKTTIGLSGLTIFPMLYVESSGSVTANFGQRAFAYTAPSGFKALCTQNLPTPTIGATSTTQANDYFNVVLYTGNGSTQSITGVGFQPDFVWCKSRSSGVTNHALFDAVRGADLWLGSNVTNAEINGSGAFLTSFNSDGFSVGSGAVVNTNAGTYVGWNWKANGAGSTNTAGSITSTVSANTTAGFAIATTTGAGGTGTIGHGLGAVPQFIMCFRRNTAADHYCYHQAIGNTNYLVLNTTAASAASANMWNNTTPTSTVFSVGNTNNNSGDTYVHYIFAPVPGYSAFGSYTGNGSADGPFVYLGFKPNFVMVKQTNTSGNSWWMFDGVRSPTNAVYNRLAANLSDAEYSNSSTFDFLSNGFKLRFSDTAWNGSGSTYIYACFAENPFKYSLAR